MATKTKQVIGSVRCYLRKL